ncbi:ATP-binding protein [Propionivibrio limicola]|uniref:ATP-binding protein n=1 Tax=Propionivibrio limicola TaxID=167645 RepID=UPI001FE3A8BA|nr:ATP-binding protein [Propionivibrio limicola]
MMNSEKNQGVLAEAPELGQAKDVAPLAPRSLEETGLNDHLLIELIVKTLYLRGNMSLIELAQQLRLPAMIVEGVCNFMRAERLVELLRHGSTSGDADYGLTEHGRSRATDFLRRCRYVGAAPVTLESYTKQVRAQSFADMRVTHADVEECYRNMVVNAELRDLVGTAMNSGKPMFLYGPSGSGKTFLAESMMRLLHGTVYVPYALVVDSEIIQVFDPIIHRPIDTESKKSGLDNRLRVDGRWVPCSRPVAISGGELTIDMLDLHFDRTSGYYQAPSHVKANNGLYIIDDLGRQIVRPEELMNRWIVPMDRRRDYLALHTGGSFEIPFDVKLVFSTNLSPSKLADEAFLRRLGYKIHIGAVSDSEYERIFRDVCDEFGITFNAETFDALLNTHRRLGRPTFACYPRDLLSQVRDYATYREWPVELTPQLIDWAWHSYFASE